MAASADNWENIIGLMTGFTLPDRGSIADTKGTSGIPWLDVDIKRLGLGSGGDLRLHSELTDSGGTIQFFTGHGDSLDKYQATVTFKDTDGHRYVVRSQNALHELLDGHRSTVNGSTDGGDPTSDNVVDLTSFTTLAQSFDKAGAYFKGHTETLKQWAESLGDENASWKGTAAGVFWHLITDLHDKYDTFTTALTPPGFAPEHTAKSTGYVATTKFGDSVIGAEVSLYDALDHLRTQLGKFTGGTAGAVTVNLARGGTDNVPIDPEPKVVLAKLLAEVADWANTVQAPNVTGRGTHTGGYMGNSGPTVWNYTTGGDYTDTIAWGSPKDTSTWAGLANEAVRRWRTNIENNLDAPARTEVTGLQQSWSRVLDPNWDSSFTFGSGASPSLADEYRQEKEELAEEEARKAAEEGKKAQDDLTDELTGLGDGINSLGDGVNGLGDGLNGFGDGLDRFSDGINAGLDEFGAGVGDGFSGIGDGLDRFAQDIDNGFRNVGQGLTDVFSGSGDASLGGGPGNVFAGGDPFGSGGPFGGGDLTATGAGDAFAGMGGTLPTSSDGITGLTDPFTGAGVTSVDGSGSTGLGGVLGTGGQEAPLPPGFVPSTTIPGVGDLLTNPGDPSLAGVRGGDGSVTTQNGDGTVTTTFPDGTATTVGPDGTVTTTNADGSTSTSLLGPGQTLTNPDGSTTTVGADGTISTHLPDGSTVTQNPDGSLVTTGPDGSTSTHFPNGVVRTTGTDGVSHLTAPDGTTMTQNPDGSLTSEFPDGSTTTVGADGSVTTTTGDGRTVTGHLGDGQSVVNPDGSSTSVGADGSITTHYPDGSTVTVNPDGTVTGTDATGTGTGTGGTGTGTVGDLPPLPDLGSIGTGTLGGAGIGGGGPGGTGGLHLPTSGADPDGLTLRGGDGSTTTHFPSGTTATTGGDGFTTTRFPDGSSTVRGPGGQFQTVPSPETAAAQAAAAEQAAALANPLTADGLAGAGEAGGAGEAALGGMMSPLMMMMGMNRMGNQGGGREGERVRETYAQADADGAFIQGGSYQQYAAPPEEVFEEEEEDPEVLPTRSAGGTPGRYGARPTTQSGRADGEEDVWGTGEEGLPASLGR
ncbi:AAWKG family protein [Streptomyces sp. J2-1]|uniref:AAWKG family protein n=1 Tax=Streptomyces corallincola TaxID=2851888 RepID=UPI001C381816|nr:AAWKG family protein [Streptomyces corallincola]MBV2354908.1 AAWKG family protein [Streptomyces corallincola]